MKKLLSLLFISTFMLWGCTSEYDDSELSGKISSIEQRVQKLETLCSQMNTNISSLQTLVAALQENDCITSVTPVMEGEKEVGYTITFMKGSAITIYHGVDGKDGADGTNGADGKDGVDGVDGANGHTPQVGVKKDADDIYYWTIDGEWMLDADGNKIKAVGTDGKNGADGTNGTNGTDGTNGADGKDGITPKLKIEDGDWYVSYDNGETYEKLGAATTEGGDCLFSKVTVDKTEIVFELADGTTFTVPRYGKPTVAIALVEQSEVAIKAGETVQLNYTLENANESTFVTASSDGYYKVEIIEPKDTIPGVIKIQAPHIYRDGFVNIIVGDANGYSSVKVLTFYERKLELKQGQDYTLEAIADTLEIPVALNYDYDIELSEGAENWLTVNRVQSRAEMVNETLEVIVKRNEDVSVRTAIVKLVSKYMANTGQIREQISITQQSANFSIDKGAFVVSNEAGEYNTKVKSSRGLSVVVPEEHSWITATATPIDAASFTLNFSVTENTTGAHRSGVISLYADDDSTAIGEIIVRQWVPVSEEKEKMIFTCLAYPAQNYKVAIPIQGDVDCYIDWGDGSDKEYVKNASLRNYEHTYTNLSKATSFDIIVTGKVKQIGILNDLVKATLTHVKQWGDTGGLKQSVDLSGCKLLESLPADETRAFAKVESFDFGNCPALTQVSAGLFAAAESAKYFHSVFENCTALETIPAKLFANCAAATGFSHAFSECTSLKAVPDSLFAGCIKVDNFLNTFYKCSSLESVGQGVFAGCEAVKSFESTFNNCTSLKSLPENMFADCVNAQEYNSTFKECSSLASLPAKMFANNKSVTNFSGCFVNTGLTALPEDLFADCVNATNFNSCFRECPIDSIPGKLFAACTEATNFAYTFYQCKALKELPKDLFATCTKVTDFGMVFFSCTSLTAIPEGLFAACTEVTSFSHAFKSCSALTTVPVGIFDNNRKVKSFSQTFHYCSSLTGESPYTEIEGVKYHLYERANNFTEFVKPSGSYCFEKCSKLTDYKNIPSDWK